MSVTGEVQVPCPDGHQRKGYSCSKFMKHLFLFILCIDHISQPKNKHFFGLFTFASTFAWHEWTLRLIKILMKGDEVSTLTFWKHFDTEFCNFMLERLVWILNVWIFRTMCSRYVPQQRDWRMHIVSCRAVSNRCGAALLPKLSISHCTKQNRSKEMSCTSRYSEMLICFIINLKE